MLLNFNSYKSLRDSCYSQQNISEPYTNIIMKKSISTRAFSLAAIFLVLASVHANPLARRREFIRNRGSADIRGSASLAGIQKRSDRSADDSEFGRGERHARFIDERDIGMGRYGGFSNLRLVKREAVSKDVNAKVPDANANEVIDADLIDLKIQQIVDKIRDHEASDRVHQNMNRRRRWNRSPKS